MDWAFKGLLWTPSSGQVDWTDEGLLRTPHSVQVNAILPPEVNFAREVDNDYSFSLDYLV
ncbi:MAG: hypothetical protein KKD35_01420 [Elusimicrobia bacterium]|nr:hypothetical protein [Elusimicrobiota bacterium]